MKQQNSITNKLYFFFKNLTTLFNTLKNQHIIYWSFNVKRCCESFIHKNCKIYPPFDIAYSRIEHSTYINVNSKISYTSIGKFCSIGPNFLCGWGIHPTNGISTSPIFYSSKVQASYTLSLNDKIQERKKITIGNDVFIGANVTILDGVTIGNGAIIGAGAVVNKDIPPYAIAVGCPIKIIKYRFSEKVIDILQGLNWWDKEEDVLNLIEKNFFNVDNFLEEIAKREDDIYA